MLSREEKNKRINQLWKRLASGDADAISAVILLLEKDLLKLAMKYLLNEQDANAVVNESFMKIFDNARKVRHRNNFVRLDEDYCRQFLFESSKKKTKMRSV